MSEEKYTDNDPERTLITLEQLSQTIEVMTSVVNRLRQHLSEQLKAQIEAREQEKTVKTGAEAADKTHEARQDQRERESFVVEIKQQQTAPPRKNSKTLH